MKNLSSLNSPNWRERKHAIETLAHSGEAAVAQALLEIIRTQNKDLGLLNATLQLLALLDAPVVPGLLQLLNDPDDEVRMYAALGLGEMRAQEAIPGLMELARTKNNHAQNANTRFNAIEALGKLRAAEAVDLLIQIAQGEDFFLVFPAIEALGRIGDPRPVPVILQMLKNDTLAPQAALTLGELGDVDIARELAAWVEQPQAYPLSAAQALFRLGQRLDAGHQIAAMVSPRGRTLLLAAADQATQPGLPPSQFEFLPGLVQLLTWLVETPAESKEQTSSEENLMAARIMKILVSLLNNSRVCQQAELALAGFGRQTVPALLSRLESDPDHEVRHSIYRLLGHAAAPQSLPLLIDALDDDDLSLAMVAARALGSTGLPEAAGPLLAQLTHPSESMRQAVAEALVQLNPPSLRERSLELVNDPDYTARQSGVRILGFLANESDLAIILHAAADESLLVRRSAIEALSAFPVAAAHRDIEKACQDPDPTMRAAACRTLASFDADFALPLLYQALSDPDPWVRLYACRSLENHARPGSLTYLAALAHDPMPPVRVAAVRALGKIGTPEAFQMIRDLLADPEIDVHTAVESALGLISGSSSQSSSDLSSGLSNNL